MKRWLSKGALAATIVLPALSGLARAGGTDDFGCSNSTLKGEYAFGVTAFTPVYPPQVVAGIKVFDGRAISRSAITSATPYQPSSPRKGKKRERI